MGSIEWIEKKKMNVSYNPQRTTLASKLIYNPPRSACSITTESMYPPIPPSPLTTSSLHSRLLPPRKLLQLQQLHRHLNVPLQILLRVQPKLAFLTLMPLNIQPDRSTAAPRPRQAHHDPTPIVEFHEDPLVLADAAVEIRVRKIVGFEDLAAVDGGVDESGFLGGDEGGEEGDDFFGAVAGDAFVVVAGEEGAAVYLPEILLDGGDAGGFIVVGCSILGDAGDDVQPGDDGPEAIFLADVVAPRAEGFFAADAHLLRVHEGAKEFPACRHFVGL